MSLITKLNEDFIIAYKAKDMVKKDFLDLSKAKMLYVKKDNQFNQWLSGNRYIGGYSNAFEGIGFCKCFIGWNYECR